MNKNESNKLTKNRNVTYNTSTYVYKNYDSTL